MASIAAPADEHPSRWRMLALLACAELLGMSLWFAGSAIAPQLAARWGLSPSQTAWLTTNVQLGFVCGTALAAVLNLADVIPSKIYFAVAALIGAAANAAVAVSGGFSVALALRFLTGVALAGVYPPAMKMAATWFRARRGAAIGTVVGALTVGKATPYLVHAFPNAGSNAVLFTASFSAVAAAVLVGGFYRDGPFPFLPRPFSWTLMHTVLKRREWRLATGGYLGHMFELYSFWTWIPSFIGASLVLERGVASPELASLIAFGTIAVGGLGCVWGGVEADARGRERLVTMAMAMSGACALLTPLLFGRSLWLLSPLSLAWGFFVIADSAQFSTLVTESVPAHAVGTALTIQTSFGYLLTMVSIQLVPPVVGVVGWRWAFPMLASGPAAGIAAIRRLAASKRGLES